MSFPPRRPKAKPSLPAGSVASQTLRGLVPLSSAPRQRRPYGVSHLHRQHHSILHAPGGPFTQLNKHSGWPDTGHDVDGMSDAQRPDHNRLGDVFRLRSVGDEDSEAHRAKARRKKENQWKNWTETILPSLLKPYLSLLRNSDTLRLPPAEVSFRCHCGDVDKRVLNVSCIYFERIELIELRICQCSPAAVQLLARSLFPCAPMTPSLAVDLKVLKFANELFLRCPPNNTAWCDALEAHLRSRGYKLTSHDSLRRRFGNALRWYAALNDSANVYIEKEIDRTREALLRAEDSESQPKEPDHSSHETSPPNPLDTSQQPPPSDSESLKRPTEYLRKRCPLCFGGRMDGGTEMDFIACIDACFEQRRRQGPHDPPYHHPNSVFLEDEYLKSVEAFVETKRPTRKSILAQRGRQEGEEDGYEESMKVPKSALDECNQSFTAADEKRQKASTQFFSDTGIMALLCRHDRVLWLANMTSAGEKQYYAIALLRRLLSHLPPWWTVGVLYDIACQLHRSCVKWGLLEGLLDRITFAISVFHAYGHQWPCQLIYHPRKCIGFGFTDGEGCERFWSLIRKLVPVLRVVGYHHRLYTLDSQVRHLDDVSLLGFGHWLSRKWMKCHERRRMAVSELQRLNIPENVLRSEWAAQVREQTKPMKRRTKDLGKRAIEEILALRMTLSTHQDAIGVLEAKLETGLDSNRVDMTEFTMLLNEAHAKASRIRTTLQRKQEALGVDARLDLQRLTNNAFLRLRMNARALKQRIRDRLRQRKFELERLERAYRVSTNENKLRRQAEDPIKRKEPGILQLVRTYNGLCDQIDQLIRERKVPLGAIAAQHISKDGLFKLDVDDDIWQDIGLDDNREGPIPGWLGDENVRTGIKNLLELDRCQEEEVRLHMERRAMQEWMMEEWTCLDATIKLSSDDLDLVYQLNRRVDNLSCLCVIWQAQVRCIDVNMPQSWGPSEEDLLQALASERQPSWDEVHRNGGNEEDEEEYDDSDSGDEEYGDLFYASEVSAMADAYHETSDELLELFMDSSSALPRSITSPRKRVHFNDHHV